MKYYVVDGVVVSEYEYELNKQLEESKLILRKNIYRLLKRLTLC